MQNGKYANLDSAKYRADVEAQAEGRFALSWQAHGLHYGIPISLLDELQAGRTAANQVQASQVMRGQSPQIDTAAARTAASNYLRAAGVDGSVTITGPTTLSVHVTIVYQPKFLGTAGIGPKTVSGDATIQLSRVVNGALR